MQATHWHTSYLQSGSDNPAGTKIFKQVLGRYCEVSNQTINLNKSIIYFEKGIVARFLSIHVGTMPFKFLGVFVGGRRVLMSYFNRLISNFEVSWVDGHVRCYLWWLGRYGSILLVMPRFIFLTVRFPHLFLILLIKEICRFGVRIMDLRMSLDIWSQIDRSYKDEGFGI